MVGGFMRGFVALGFVVALGGCSSVSDLLSFDSAPQEEPVTQAAAVPAPATAPDDSLCQHVAVQDATGNGFDPVTQKKVAAQSYAQCRAIFNR
jgi:hypothetical protein